MTPHPFTLAADAIPTPDGFARATVRTFTPAQFSAVFPGRDKPNKKSQRYNFPSEPLPLVIAGRLPAMKGSAARFFAIYYKPATS